MVNFSDVITLANQYIHVANKLASFSSAFKYEYYAVHP